MVFKNSKTPILNILYPLSAIMKTINLFGAPGAGKSTAMLGLTYHLKLMGLSAENTPEFFKEMLYEDSQTEKFGGQLYVLGEQNRRLARLVGKNDFAITDCPLPLIGYYTPADYVPGFTDFVKNLYNRYDNINYFIIPRHEFEAEKRIHDEQQAKAISEKLPSYLNELGIGFKIIESGEDLVTRLIEDLISEHVISPQHLQGSRSEKVRRAYGGRP